MTTWAVIGASRGLGHEFVSQILQSGNGVVATVRKLPPSKPWPNHAGECALYTCDMLSPESIKVFVTDLGQSGVKRLDYVILNAGILQYSNRATETSYDDFLLHLKTNTVGPIFTAQTLLQSAIEIGMLVFISSDSGSASQFNEFEDGFAAYAASKAALNQALRHMAAELRRKNSPTIVVALHPGEVKTDMANIELDWEVHGQMTPEESVRQCLQTIRSKTYADHGTFWTWDNKVGEASSVEGNWD